jgi:MlaD protein
LRSPLRLGGIAALAGSALLFAASLATRGAEPYVHFRTQLDSGGIAPGSPVTHSGVRIGAVKAISPLGHGDVDVGFDVEAPYAAEVHQDSIIVLENGAGSSLELVSPDPTTPRAAPKSRLDGASSPSEAQMLIMSRPVTGFALDLSRVLLALTPSPSPSAATPLPSPASAELQESLMRLSADSLAVAAASSPATHIQLDQLGREAAGLERQLRRNGKAAQADRLRDSVERLLARSSSPSSASSAPGAPAVAPSGSSGAPNSLDLPRVYPSKP